MWLAAYRQSAGFCVSMNRDKRELRIMYMANGKRKIQVKNFSK